MLNLSGADAAINCWNDKYYCDLWRPWQAIRKAARDGNPATEPDPSWTALLTAPYPDHTSGHLCLDGAHLNVLRVFFGTDEIGFDVTSSLWGALIQFRLQIGAFERQIPVLAPHRRWRRSSSRGRGARALSSSAREAC